MADFYIRKGDRLPEIAATLTDANGTPIPLTGGATVKFRMYAPGAASGVYKVDTAALITDAGGGKVSYPWAAINTDTAGEFLAHWVVTFADGRIETFPNRDPLVIDIMAIGELGWTYTGDPVNSPRDQVRFYIGDTDSARPVLTDDEIAWVLSQESESRMAAAMAAEIIASRYSGKGQKTVGDLSIDFASKAQGYFDLADRLRNFTANPINVLPHPYAGGIDAFDKKLHEDEVGYFRVGIHDYARVDELRAD